MDLVIKYTYSIQYIAHGKRTEHSFLQRQLSIVPHQKYRTVLSTQQQDNAMLEYSSMHIII